jgi:glyoxylase-like metal-dependent hydrolase (beta-lactamase superfamily II)
VIFIATIMERFPIMRISDNVEMLEISGMGGAIYPTLVWDENNLVLIDTGFPGQTETIVKAIEGAGFSVEGLTHIIITHQDMDHIGCVNDLRKLAPKTQVLIYEDEAPYLDGKKVPVKLAAMLKQYDSLPDAQKKWCDDFKEGYANRRISASRTLSDSDVLQICGGIEVIHTPGHTPGHMCLLLRESGVLVCGDALNIKDGELVGPNPLHSYDMELGLLSVEKVKNYPFRSVVTYHGGYSPAI